MYNFTDLTFNASNSTSTVVGNLDVVIILLSILTFEMTFLLVLGIWVYYIKLMDV